MSYKITDLNTPHDSAKGTDLFEMVQEPGLPTVESENRTLDEIAAYVGGAAGALQLYSTTDADPNVAGILPGNQSAAAEFYQDPSITIYNRWSWSIVNKNWVQYVSPGSA